MITNIRPFYKVHSAPTDANSAAQVEVSSVPPNLRPVAVDLCGARPGVQVPVYAYENTTSGVAADQEYLNERTRLGYFKDLHLSKTIDFLEREGLAKATKFADVGCGIAFLDFALARKYPQLEVYALDKEAKHINFNSAEKNSEGNLDNLNFAIYDLMKPHPDLEGQFDMVSSSLVMAHMADPVSALKNMTKLLKPGGKLLAEEIDISSVKANNEFPALEKFQKLWGEVISSINCDAFRGPKLIELFREAGLKEIKSNHYLVTEPQETIKLAILGVIEKPKVQELLLKFSLVESQQEIDDLIIALKQGFADSEMKIDFYNLHQVAGVKP